MPAAGRARATRMVARAWWLPLAPIGFLADRGSRYRWLLMPGIVILTALISSIGKLAIRRPRPGSADRLAPWGRLGAAGFPSTHSACAFAIAGWLRASRHGRWLHAVATLIGYSRVRYRAHHLTDVIAGAILGYGIAWQVERAWSRLVPSRADRAVSSAGKHRPIRSFGPRTVKGSMSRDQSPSRRDHVAAPAGHGGSARSARRRDGAGPSREPRAKRSPLEVG